MMQFALKQCPDVIAVLLLLFYFIIIIITITIYFT